MTNSNDRHWFRCVRYYSDAPGVDRIEYLFPTDEATARVEAIASPDSAVKIELQRLNGNEWHTMVEFKR